MQSQNENNAAYYVYTLTNIITGDIYVGKSKDPEYRWGVHKSLAKNERRRTTHFYKAIHHYGADSFTLSIVESTTDESKAYELERLLICEL